MSRTKDEALRLLEKLADSLKLEPDSVDYQDLEHEFYDEPSAVAKKYYHLLDPEEQRFLGYYIEVDPPQKTLTTDELRRMWPQPQQPVKVWNREVFARASGRRKAWLLGWNAYARLPSLQSPENDVSASAEVLCDRRLGHFESTIVAAADAPDAKSVEKRLTDAIEAATEDDSLLVYYSGHGFCPEKGDGLFLAVPDTDFAKPASAIDVNAISAAYARSKCQSLLLVLDCCQSGGVALDVSRIGKKQRRPRRRAHQDAFGLSGLRVLASSSRAQESLEDMDPNTGLSVFTGGLLDGLRSGRADADDDGAVTDAEAFAYVRSRLASQYLLERQSPMHHVVEGQTPFLLTLNERAIAPPSLYAIAPEYVGMHLAMQAMAALVRESAPILFTVGCTRYYFRDVEAVALASGLTVSPMHTPYLRASQGGLVCETYFTPPLVPERLLEQRRPVNGLVQCGLELRFEDVLLISGMDFTTRQHWDLYVPPGTLINRGP